MQARKVDIACELHVRVRGTHAFSSRVVSNFVCYICPNLALQATDLATFTLETLFQNLNFAVKIFRYLMDPCVHLTLMQ